MHLTAFLTISIATFMVSTTRAFDTVANSLDASGTKADFYNAMPSTSTGFIAKRDVSSANPNIVVEAGRVVTLSKTDGFYVKRSGVKIQPGKRWGVKVHPERKRSVFNDTVSTIKNAGLGTVTSGGFGSVNKRNQIVQEVDNGNLRNLKSSFKRGLRKRDTTDKNAGKFGHPDVKNDLGHDILVIDASGEDVKPQS